jgi:CRISPR-associated protein Csm1
MIFGHYLNYLKNVPRARIIINEAKMIKLIDNKDVTKIQIDEYEDVQIACVLHDIGKFHQRAYKKYHHTPHEKLSKSFVKSVGRNAKVENMVLSHMGKSYSSPLDQKDKFLSGIIQKADSYSSKEREDRMQGMGDAKVEPIVSIFSKLRINEKKDGEEFFYPVKKLDLENLSFPVRSKKEAVGDIWENLRHSYEKEWEEFSKDVKKVSNKYLSFSTIYYLLKKYTSFIPSAAWKSYPDIALFDHSKTTAAIGSCMYLYIAEKDEHIIRDKTKYFTMISGEISGIQNFIYDVSSPQSVRRGMAKRLRGRSFYTNLLNENLAMIIIDRLELTDANILWCGGGHFLIVAPNTDNAKKILDDYEREVNEFLFNKHGDKLYLSLIRKEVSGKDLDNFVSLKENMVYDNARKVRQQHIENLDMIFQEEKSAPLDICNICGSASNGGICHECGMHEDIGDKITRSDYIVRVVTKDDSSKNEFDIFGLNVGYLISKKEDLLEKIEKIHDPSSKIHISTLNNTDFLDSDIIGKLEEKNIQASFGFSFLGNTTPYHDKYGALDFEHIAKISRGTKKLGIFKMNVDNVEKLFETGLSNTSISRISTMSSLLDIFMSGYVNEIIKEYYILPDTCPECRVKVDDIELTFQEDIIKVYREKEKEGVTEKVCSKCEEKKIPILYIGYSGGDDLLVIGPWDMIIKFSKDIRDRFKRYMCMNKDINVSAGIFMCGPKFPIDKAVHIVDDILKDSKTLGKDMI